MIAYKTATSYLTPDNCIYGIEVTKHLMLWRVCVSMNAFAGDYHFL